MSPIIPKLNPHDKIRILDTYSTRKLGINKLSGVILYYLGEDDYKVLLENNQEMNINVCYMSKIFNS